MKNKLIDLNNFYSAITNLSRQQKINILTQIPRPFIHFYVYKVKDGDQIITIQVPKEKATTFLKKIADSIIKEKNESIEINRD